MTPVTISRSDIECLIAEIDVAMSEMGRETFWVRDPMRAKLMVVGESLWKLRNKLVDIKTQAEYNETTPKDGEERNRNDKA